ncbi:MAG TPA: BON domain-containing protein, partial [Noviherbaspirillum sp.]|nr:BON domain-containing protein [Noviherbaspirillum sp.]
MKNTKLIVALFAAAFAAGCGTVGQQGAAPAGAQPQAQAPVVDDAVVTSRVQAALAADPEVSPIKINVSTNAGRVTLKGEIKSMALRKRVESIVRGVEGVRSLDNQL